MRSFIGVCSFSILSLAATAAYSQSETVILDCIGHSTNTFDHTVEHFIVITGANATISTSPST